jgi:hypothetical protein
MFEELFPKLLLYLAADYELLLKTLKYKQLLRENQMTGPVT